MLRRVREFGPMPTRRPTSQVHPRPPSNGRPKPTRVTPRRRLDARTAYVGIQRPAGLPLAARLLLAVAIVALGGLVLLTATGSLTKLVAGFGSQLGSAVNVVTATEGPTAIPSGPIDIPTLVAPTEAYTNKPAVDITGQLPGVAVGQSGYRIRLYVTFKGKQPAQVAEIAAPATTAFFTFPAVSLESGANDFTATVLDAAGNESQPSSAIRYVLDTTPPKTTISSPKAGATIDTPTVDLIGRTQARSSLTVRNEANASTVTGTAAADGTFRITVPLDPGPNGLTITATDPAGNVGTTTIGVTRGGKTLTVVLHASTYRFTATKLPSSLTLTAIVTDPTGAPVPNADVTFSLSIPGVPVVTQDVPTDGTGTAVFQTTVPKGASVGSGPALAFVTTTQFGTASDRVVITVQ